MHKTFFPYFSILALPGKSWEDRYVLIGQLLECYGTPFALDIRNKGDMKIESATCEDSHNVMSVKKSRCQIRIHRVVPLGEKGAYPHTLSPFRPKGRRMKNCKLLVLVSFSSGIKG